MYLSPGPMPKRGVAFVIAFIPRVFKSTLMFCFPQSKVLILVPISPVSLAPQFALHAISTRTPAM
jgi:hypothetical protein